MASEDTDPEAHRWIPDGVIPMLWSGGQGWEPDMPSLMPAAVDRFGEETLAEKVEAQRRGAGYLMAAIDGASVIGVGWIDDPGRTTQVLCASGDLDTAAGHAVFTRAMAAAAGLPMP